MSYSLPGSDLAAKASQDEVSRRYVDRGTRRIGLRDSGKRGSYDYTDWWRLRRNLVR